MSDPNRSVEQKALRLLGRLGEKLGERIGEVVDEVTLPDRVRRALDEAELRLAAGEPRVAEQLLQGVEAERPGLWRTGFLLGLVAEALGDASEANRRLEAAAAARDGVLVRIALGRVAASLGHFTRAREHYEAALERSPREAERYELLVQLAAVYERTGPPARVITVLRQAARLQPAESRLRLRLGRALAAEGDLDGAISALDPERAESLPALDSLLLAAECRVRRDRQEDLGVAAAIFQSILGRSGDNPDALEGLARIWMRQGRVADALPLLQQALTTAPRSAMGRLHHAVGACHLASGQSERAMEAFRTALQTDPGRVECRRQAGRTALELGRIAEAESVTAPLLDLAPNDASARALRGRVALAGGDAASARLLLTPLRAARQTPEIAHALGELALRTGDPIEAIALLREAAQAEGAGVAELLGEAYGSLAPSLPELGPIEEIAPPRLAPFLESLSGAVAAHPLLVDLISPATALRQRLDAPLTIAVLGEFNAGKSTLINAFVGEEMVATGVLPTTSHVNVVRYGPRRVARWTRADGSVEELPYAAASRLVKDNPSAIAQLEFCYPHPDLRSIHFLDTPGFNAPDEEHEARAAQALRSADAIVWMLDVHQALSSTEYERIRTIHGADEKLLVAVNKVDRLDGSKRDLQQVLAHVERHLAGRQAGLFPVSALGAFRARVAGDSEALARSGWPVFEDAVRDRFFEQAGRLKSLEVAAGLRELIGEILRRSAASREMLRAQRGEVVRVRTDLVEVASRWTHEVAIPTRASVDRGYQALRTRIAEQVGELALPAGGLLGRRRLHDDDRGLVVGQFLEGARATLVEATAEVLRRADRTDGEVVGLVEAVAVQLGPPESRTLRRRLEGYLAETAALRRLLRERLVQAPMAVVRARVVDQAEPVLSGIAGDAARSEAEREIWLRRLLPPTEDDFRGELTGWGEEYLAAAERLCHHVERDLDIQGLDLEHRIDRPFEAVRRLLGPRPGSETDPSASGTRDETPRESNPILPSSPEP